MSQPTELPATATLDTLKAALATYGMLPLTDALVPSVVSLIAGGPVRGSWWSHPKAHEIYAVAGALETFAPSAKLLDGKVTFLHPRLWPALVGVGLARETWQMEGLPDESRAILDQADAQGAIEASGDAVRQLEMRVLVHTLEVHTRAGAHRKQVRSWATFAAERQVTPLSAEDGRAALGSSSRVLARAAARSRAGKLPWDAK